VTVKDATTTHAWVKPYKALIPDVHHVVVKLLVDCAYKVSSVKGFGRRKEQLYFEGVGLKPEYKC